MSVFNKRHLFTTRRLAACACYGVVALLWIAAYRVDAIAVAPLDPPEGLRVISMDTQSARLHSSQPDIAAKSVIEIEESDQSRIAQQAMRIETRGASKNVWDVQVSQKTGESLHRGQPGVLRFWARCPVGPDTKAAEINTGETPEVEAAAIPAVQAASSGQVAVYLQRAAEPWDKSFMSKLKVASDWQLYEIPFRVHDSFAVGDAQLCFGVGFDPQVIDIAAIELITFPMDVDLETLRSTTPN